VHTYETLFITPPTLTEDEERSTVDAMARVVADGGGQMVANERMGRRRLAYPIRKFEDGVYTRFLYDAEAAVPKELERRIRLSDRVLRSLTVRLEDDWAVEAKEEAVREAERRERAEAEKAAEAEAAAKAEAEAAAKGEGESTEDEGGSSTAGGGETAGEASAAPESATTPETQAQSSPETK
jgi:small subunit ribosomal protein S6